MSGRYGRLKNLPLAGTGQDRCPTHRPPPQEHGGHAEEPLDPAQLREPEARSPDLQDGLEREHRLHHKGIPEQDDHSGF